MRMICALVSVSLLLHFACVKESCGVPVTELPQLEEATQQTDAETQEEAEETWIVRQPEEAMATEDPTAEDEETSAETWIMPFWNKDGAMGGAIRCRYCCGCCVDTVCGMCCK